MGTVIAVLRRLDGTVVVVVQDDDDQVSEVVVTREGAVRRGLPEVVPTTVARCRLAGGR